MGRVLDICKGCPCYNTRVFMVSATDFDYSYCEKTVECRLPLSRESKKLADFVWGQRPVPTGCDFLMEHKMEQWNKEY